MNLFKKETTIWTYKWNLREDYNTQHRLTQNCSTYLWIPLSYFLKSRCISSCILNGLIYTTSNYVYVQYIITFTLQSTKPNINSPNTYSLSSICGLGFHLPFKNIKNRSSSPSLFYYSCNNQVKRQNSGQVVTVDTQLNSIIWESMANIVQDLCLEQDWLKFYTT